MGCPKLQPWPELRLLPQAPEPLPFPAASWERHCPQWHPVSISSAYRYNAAGIRVAAHSTNTIGTGQPGAYTTDTARTFLKNTYYTFSWRVATKV